MSVECGLHYVLYPIVGHAVSMGMSVWWGGVNHKLGVLQMKVDSERS